jgi:hypothetical protein
MADRFLNTSSHLKEQATMGVFLANVTGILGTRLIRDRQSVAASSMTPPDGPNGSAA